MKSINPWKFNPAGPIPFRKPQHSITAIHRYGAFPKQTHYVYTYMAKARF
ncbi:hypothetical protein MKJ04_00105 [Pontibacter sp. E15-1]|nr:hypothetical protein [Pontibacter sp. E15-1]MCJ8163223.1 hypothetical protein [Pontibacter sp. E15-1]